MSLKNIEKENKNQEILNYIAECENKIKAHEKKKKRIMKQFVDEEIQIANYIQLIEMIDEQCSILENELKKAKSEIVEETSSDISKEDIIIEIPKKEIKKASSCFTKKSLL
jgi:hypothetical protein